MFSKTPEVRIIKIRAVLLLLWLVLIASLFWDPLTAVLTDPEISWSPFSVKSASFDLLGETLDIHPYAMGNRLFWTMLVPILPIFLMTLGHEAWRRICPLSLASQLPRLFGIQRRRVVQKPGKAEPERVPYLISPNSWLARNTWYVQYGLLLTGLSFRLIGANSDRTFLAVMLLSVISAAIFSGFLWGGKTWCNYFCPINVVQRIYTEPRGLLESTPHLSKPVIPQSMCRTPVASAEKAACVGCTRSCGDIDLEKSYWDSIENPQRQNVYYMFIGLIIGFYGYYWAYSGSWDYYFSGVWTHEPAQVARNMDPGFYFLRNCWWLPKLIAAPLTLILCSAATLMLGRGLQSLYIKMRANARAVTKVELINHCLAVSSFLSINLFYFFGGQPNLYLLPIPIQHCINMAVVVTTSFWLWRTLRRSPHAYQRESVAGAMFNQIKSMNINLSDRFDGRALEDLHPDEVYILSKVLPDISRQEKLAAYYRVIHEAILQGKTQSVEFLEALNVFRLELGITDHEHLTAIKPVSAADTEFDDPDVLSEDELRRCVEDYYNLVGPIIADRVAAGLSIDEALRLPEVSSAVEVLRSSFYISEDAHLSMLQRLTSLEGLLVQRSSAVLAELRAISAVRGIVGPATADDPVGRALYDLMLRATTPALMRKGESLSALLFSILGTTETNPVVRERFVQNAVAPFTETAPVCRWEPIASHAPPDGTGNEPAYAILDDLAAKLAASNEAAFVDEELRMGMRCIFEISGPLSGAVALAACGYSDKVKANLLAAEVPAARPEDWLLIEVLSDLREAPIPSLQLRREAIEVEVAQRGMIKHIVTMTESDISIGRAPGNTISINDPALAPYHLLLRRSGHIVQVIPLTHATLYVGDTCCMSETIELENGACLSLGLPEDEPITIRVVGNRLPVATGIQPWGTFAKMISLVSLDQFRSTSLTDFAVIARDCLATRHPKGEEIKLPSQGCSRILLLQSGHVEAAETTVAVEEEAGHAALHLFDPGCGHSGPESCLEARTYTTPLRVTSDFAIILVLPEKLDTKSIEVEGAQPSINKCFGAFS